MKTLIAACIYLLNIALITAAQASPLETSTYNNIIYFADDRSTALKRYSLENEKFLAPITLAKKPSALHVDNSGIYLGYNTSLVKLDLSGANAIPIHSTSDKITDIEATDQYLIVAGDRFMQSLNKSDYSFVAETKQEYPAPNISVSPDNRQIYYTRERITPEEIYQIALLSDGTFGSALESPYHGDYAIAPNPVFFPTKNRVVVSSGNVFNTMDLTFAGSIGGLYSDIGFWQGLPIVLRDNQLHSYNQAMLETGVYPLPPAVTSSTMAIYGNSIFVFGRDALGDDQATKVDIALLSPADPAAPVNPSELSYTPNSFALDNKQDTVFLLSKAHLNIFRWSISQSTYLESIPLLNPPLSMSYSAEHGRIYLSYSNGDINYIDLADYKEYPFIHLSSATSTMLAVGQYLIVNVNSSWSAELSTYNKQGIKTDSQRLNWINSISEIAWDSYHAELSLIDRYSLRRAALDPTSGLFGDANDNEYASNSVWNPMRISETGRFIAFGNGQLLDRAAYQQSEITLTYYIKDIAWLHGNLFTLDQMAIDSQTYSLLQRRSADFTVIAEATYEVQGEPIGLLPIVSSGKMLLIYSRAGIPQFTVLTYAAADFDKDGYLDNQDQLPTLKTEWQDLDDDGIGNIADTDDDGDGVLDTQDLFPLNGKETLDADKDGIGNNADPDDDNDGVLDNEDAFPLDATESADLDYDGIGNNKDDDLDGDNILNRDDAFPINVFEWSDRDKDGEGDNADLDDDNDGVLDTEDALPFDPTESSDLDHDGIGDNTDPDIDGDYALNANDAFPLNPGDWLDSDKDGKGDNMDSDDDNDGIADVNDFYPLDASKSQFHAADFLPLAAGSAWRYDNSDTPATLAKAITVAGQSITPIQLPSGRKLYLKVIDNQIQFFGFYLPLTETPYGNYKTDLTFNTGVDLLSGANNMRGTGNVNISPTYGNRALTWYASVENLGLENIKVPAQTYTALHTQIHFSGAVTIEGQQVYVLYDLDLWFAENVGLVKLSENGYTSNLGSATLPQPTTSTNPGPAPSGKSGGGKSDWPFLAALLLLSLGYRWQQNKTITR